jgi:hypothetical protein
MNDLIDGVRIDRRHAPGNGDSIYGRGVDVIELRRAWAWCSRSRTRSR